MTGRTHVPDGWEVARLGDILVLDQPGAWGDEPSPDDPGVRVLRSTDFTRDGRIDPKSAASRRLSERDRERRLMRDGDLILERSGGGPGTPVGRVAIIDGFGPVYCNNFCQHLRVDTSRCSPFYAVRALWHRYLQGVTTRLQHQTTGIRNLDYTGYLAFPILLPPLPEQRAIAAVLDAIDEAIERTEGIIAATERLRDALLHELLTRGVPGRHSEWKEAPGIGTIPACWDVVRLGDVAEVRNGTTPSRAETNYWQDGDVPFIKTGQVNDTLIEVPDEFITSQAVASAGAVVVPRGSVLIAMIGQGKTRGMTAQLRIDAAINQNFAVVFGADGDFSLDFFFTWARQNYSHIRALGQGSNQDALNCALIEGMRVPKPTLAEQQTIVAVANSMEESIERGKMETAMLRSLKLSAADGLFTGRVRVGGR